LLGLSSVGVALVVACSGATADESSGPGDGPNATDDAGASSCAASLPQCTVAPSFSSTIEPLVQRTCAGCHGPGGVAADRDLTTYANIAKLEVTELVQLYSCQMPPADAGPDAMLSLPEREAMMQWFICGYPDN
jgi:hypothetical protein